ncbi:MAG: hypothetical protein M0008_01335 [Actinomycetota bacterium]|jgi:hypothetical protein|nr:hypothetical protein [Actinomycetota bacterium]
MRVEEREYVIPDANQGPVLIGIKLRSALLRQSLEAAGAGIAVMVGLIDTFGLLASAGFPARQACLYIPGGVDVGCNIVFCAFATIGTVLLIGGSVLVALIALRMLRSGLFLSTTSVTMYGLAGRWAPVSRAMTIPKAQVADVMVMWSPEEPVYGVPNSRKLRPTGRVVVQLVDGRKLSGAGLTYWLPVSQSRRRHLENRIELLKQHIRSAGIHQESGKVVNQEP